MYAENIHTNAIDAAKPKNKINFQVYSIFENHSLNINWVVGSKLVLLNWPAHKHENYYTKKDCNKIEIK